jgi:D-glycero-alpha-D-manno-heptose-7-phosphate kinase
MELDGYMDYAKTAICELAQDRGLDMQIETKAPVGVGLGTSGSMMVAIVGALLSMSEETPTSREISEIAARLEREAGIICGRQDHYAAAFGSVNQLEFSSSSCTVRRLDLDEEDLRSLEAHVMVVRPGGSRCSSEIVGQVVRAYEAGCMRTHNAIDCLNWLAQDIGGALESGSFHDLGTLLQKVRKCQMSLHPEILDTRLNGVISDLEKSGIVGAKILGGGGPGGSLLVLVPPIDQEKAHRIFKASRCQVLPTRIARRGIRLEVSKRRLSARLKGRPATGGETD